MIVKALHTLPTFSYKIFLHFQQIELMFNINRVHRRYPVIASFLLSHSSMLILGSSIVTLIMKARNWQDHSKRSFRFL